MVHTSIYPQPLGANIRTCVEGQTSKSIKVPSLMASLQIFILGCIFILGAPQATSSTIQDSANAPRGHNSSARESHSLNMGLESGPAGQAWVHTHWYQQQPSKSNKAEAKVRIERFARPLPKRYSISPREKRSNSREIFRERRHARFGGRAGLGLHWARDQFGHKLVLDRCFPPSLKSFQN